MIWTWYLKFNFDTGKVKERLIDQTSVSWESQAKDPSEKEDNLKEASKIIMFIGIDKKRTTLLTLFDFWLFSQLTFNIQWNPVDGNMHWTYNSVHIIQISVFSRLTEKMQQAHVLSI